jgi:hypothetical protein
MPQYASGPYEKRCECGDKRRILPLLGVESLSSTPYQVTSLSQPTSSRDEYIVILNPQSLIILLQCEQAHLQTHCFNGMVKQR